ncbi:diaminopimelate decarboxylase [Sandaracinobacteroides saxicola]|uniref:Diaminopimelate decarboxylase n=1 Tax=Sandaracinobacteroides saxicola TaxID=2759707 RepID=A0A7G5IIU8_9SPHN|nr:diaminopimelate decarboxylase [Sandaracinobacteroides saxicola]QMW23290.1 diaminopimelate decarboxylase [Sandaracinobacteroides saxicola]
MDHFHDRDGVMHAEDVALDALAAAEGTPFYAYSSATIERHFTVFRDALAGLDDPLIAFAVKANPNVSVIATLARLGAGADVVSEGEMRRALAAGVPAGRIIFSGVGKTRAEMAAALIAGIFQFNVEGEGELHALSEVAAALGRTASVAIRVNPDVDARTHAKISTGKKENKFGVPLDRIAALYATAAGLPGIRPVGVAAHIGSQLASLEPLEEAYGKLGALVATLRRQGQTVERVDLGGGLGIPYDPSLPPPPGPAAYGAMVARVTAGWGVRLAFEPGRLIVGNAGVLVARVITVKSGGERTFVVLDAAMNDLLRPSLYGAWHDIRALSPRAGGMTATIVGPVCETGDQFAEDRSITPVQPGDLVAVMTAGAYGATMASTYNSRPLIPEILVRGRDYAVVRPRQTLDQLIGADRIAPWLKERP